MLGEFRKQPSQFLFGEYPFPLVVLRKFFDLPARVLAGQVVPDGEIEDPLEGGPISGNTRK